MRCRVDDMALRPAAVTKSPVYIRAEFPMPENLFALGRAAVVLTIDPTTLDGLGAASLMGEAAAEHLRSWGRRSGAMAARCSCARV
jgi:hypothetical protein